jgi:hypothetical protein
MIKVMTKTELKRLQTKEIIELLESKFNATNFDNDQGSYFTFNIGEFTGQLERRDFSVMIHEAMRMGPGFTQEEYDIRDAAEVLEDAVNKEIKNYLNK